MNGVSQRIFSALLFALIWLSGGAEASQPHYSLEFLQTSDRKLVNDQALVISGVVSVPCRVLNQLGTWVLRCGLSQDKARFEKALGHLHKLGFGEAKLVTVEQGSEMVITTFEPIKLSADSQANLLTSAKKQQSVQVDVKPSKIVAPAAIQRDLAAEQLKQGEYFVGRGWAAHKLKDYDMALSLFKLAEKIDAVKLDALFGLSMVYYDQQKYQLALNAFETLLAKNHQTTTIVPLLLNAAMTLGLSDKVASYYKQLPPDQLEFWQKQLSLQAMEKEFEKLKGQSTLSKLEQFQQRHKQWLDSCQGMAVWQKLGQGLIKHKAPKKAQNVYLKLWKNCKEEAGRVGILYQLDKVHPYDLRMSLLNQEQKKNNSKTYHWQLDQYRFNAMMTQASKLQDGSDAQGAVYFYMSEFWRENIQLNRAKAWWLYHHKDYDDALTAFNQLWQSKQDKQALQGTLHALTKLQQLNKAIALSEQLGEVEMTLLLLKGKLAESPIPSLLAIETATRILALEPEYPPALSALGWTAMAGEQWLLAQTYFNRWLKVAPDNEGAATGLLQSLTKQLLYDEALVLAKKLDKGDEYKWQHSVLYEKALKLFNHKVYDKAKLVFEQLLAWQPEQDDIKTLYAWTLFHLKNYKPSSKMFLAQYKKQPDPAMAQGYLSALDALESRKKKKAFVRELSQSKETSSREIAAGQYSAIKNYIRAAYAAQGKDSYYKGVNSLEFWLDYNYRHKEGDAGISAMKVHDLQLGASFVWQPASRLTLTLNGQWIDSHLRAENPFLGDDLTYGDIPNTTPGADLSAFDTKQTVWYPYLRYQREDNWNLDMGIGLSPLSGPLGSKLTWHFTAQSKATGNASINIHRKPMFDNQLSYLGLKDPYSDRKWGRVMETGVKVKHTGSISDGFWYTAVGEYDRYAGSNLITNQSGKLDLLVGTDYPIEDIETSFGLMLSLAGYQRNSIFYSFGHGGYFSPQEMGQLAFFTHWESHKSKVDWWQFDFNLGYFNWRTKPHERYPLGIFKQTAASEQSNGLSWSVRGEKHWLIDDSFELGVGAEINQSPGHEEFRAGLTFRYFWSERNYLIPKHMVIRPYAH